MIEQINPFQNLYVTERLSAREFVHLFCPILVSQAPSLFQSGNVVLQGTQGSGKTTLLSLLKPNIREAYCLEGIKFPVAEEMSKFISAGINLTKSGALDFGRRPVNREQPDEELFPLYFADFFNYHILEDVINNISLHDKKESTKNRNHKLAELTKKIKRSDCWFDFFSDCDTFEDIIHRIHWRITQYRSFHQFNIEMLDDSILKTKTNIGEPISRIARILKEVELIPSDTAIFVRIDQLEILLDCDEIRENLGKQYRRIINTALSTRDPHVSYKIGTRTYAWGQELRTYRAETPIEDQRDYTLIDFDEILRRPENRAYWVYPDFAKNVFRRRLQFAGWDIPQTTTDKALFKEIFGLRKKPHDLARQYAQKTDTKRALKIPNNFPTELVKDIGQIFDKDPLTAILAVAWYRQKPQSINTHNEGVPWKSKYWQKERNKQALMQLAANCAQSLIWGGEEEIINLTSAGILGFLSVCQHIWDVYLRINSQGEELKKIPSPLDGINTDIQTLGIVSASKQWFKKIAELPGGNDRQRFIALLGTSFRKKLLSDVKMSYPGHNGFSLRNSEFEKIYKIKKALHDATDYGVLVSTPHTSKEKNDGMRTKWYLNPIYCPHFQLPEERIKEPYYAEVNEVEDWLDAAFSDIKTISFKKKPDQEKKRRKLSTNNLSQQFLFSDECLQDE